MARMRSLKPEFWTDEELACQLTRDERFMYLGLWNLADEHSRLRGDPRYIKGQLFAYDDDITAEHIEKMLGTLADLGKVRQYRVGPGRYLFLPNLSKHQRLETDKVPSRLPSPDQDDSHATSPESRANKNGRDLNEPAPDANEVSLLQVAWSMEHGAGGSNAPARVPAAPPRRTMLGNQLLDEHTAECKTRPPRSVVAKLGDAIDSLLDEPDIQPDEIREGLAVLRGRPDLGPGVLPNLVHEVRERRAGVTPQRASPGLPDRNQQATDAKFDRAMERALRKEGRT